ncbi:hypothetical protein [Biformimicrobium ophioploci]|uniref:HD domain-containing protein n=1 Tax=Biformimicrobium ophioploci TaxID=3036711 RepID=A0ABQ6LWR6_9GAMM|nr:hypothetical protein [Microbulbifer sp. NKW57]GMG86503.1 HD domain-containing protein [Microbulbifer sp. NKW57]
MQIAESIPMLDDILAPWRDTIGADFQGYRNHVSRMLNFCFLLRDCSEEERHKHIIAGAFHDIGIWVNNTVDYVPPSIPPAVAYLEEHDPQAWSDEITLMISEHHKMRAYQSEYQPLVELFRQGDLVDFSCGAVRFGLPKNAIRAVKGAYPNAGFHKGLMKKAGKWLLKHPLNPAPMMKW